MNKPISILIILASMWFAMPAFGQSVGKEQATKLQNYTRTRPQEKLFVHLDKPFYSVKDDIWFKVYLVDAANHLPRKEAVVYMELLDDRENIILERNIQITDGGGFGDIDLSRYKLEYGDYVLRGYTSYMRNFDEEFFFHQKISLVDPDVLTEKTSESNVPKLDIQFFPEGGELVADGLNFIGFKVSGKYDISDKLTGVVVDDQGNELTEFHTENFGLGAFPIKIEQAKKLYAKVSYNGENLEFPLPEVKSSGYKLSVRNTGGNLVIVGDHTAENQMEDAFVIIHQRGKLLGIVEAEDKAIRNNIALQNLPAGIVTFTLFGSDGVPVRERIVFVENDEQARKDVAIETNSNTYKNREKVEIDIKSLSGDEFSGTGSVSILNLDLIPADSRKSHLLSYLLLSSDIKGEIENPAYYFDEDNEDRIRHLDILMLTQGWRRFSWEEVLDENPPLLSYPIEKGFSIQGQLTSYYNKDKTVKGEVQLNIIEEPGYVQKVMTDENGYFYFPDLIIGDTATLILQSNKFNKKKNRVTDNSNLSIKLIEPERHEPVLPEFSERVEFKKEMTESYLEAFERMQLIDSVYDLEGVTLLKEFSVRSNRDVAGNLLSPTRMADALYGRPTKRIMVDSIERILPFSTVFDVLRNTAGVRVTGSFPQQGIWIRGNGPLILLDGVQTSVSTLSTLNINDVAFIDLFIGPDAAIYGAQSANGVLSVFTREGPAADRSRPVLGIQNFKYPGFTLAREFYTPDYTVETALNNRPDYRTTLYWNPDIDFEAEETLEFFTSDEKGKYLIHLQGITEEGKIIVEEKVIEVK
ncbi:MAG: Plug domain-containing protein [Cyclobacteriaceae bacterium]